MKYLQKRKSEYSDTLKEDKTMDIFVCIGSACHIKGSYAVLNGLQDRVQAAGLEESVILKASFCMGECTRAVSVRVDDGPVQSVSPDTIDEFFSRVIRASGLCPANLQL